MAGDFGEAQVRWRLVLGQAAQGALGGALSEQAGACDGALSWLYNRDGQVQQRGVRARPGQRRAGSEDPGLAVVESDTNRIHRLFPQETIERLERDAVEKYQVRKWLPMPRCCAASVRTFRWFRQSCGPDS